MKKILPLAILSTALLIGNTCAAAPKEINHPDSIYYMQPDFYSMTSTGERIILTHYPTYQQTSDYSCESAAALTVLKYFSNHDYDEATLIKRMKTKPKIGTSLSNTVKFFKDIGWDIQSSLDTPPMDEFEFQ